jgi:hypothetical protein
VALKTEEGYVITAGYVINATGYEVVVLLKKELLI